MKYKQLAILVSVEKKALGNIHDNFATQGVDIVKRKFRDSVLPLIYFAISLVEINIR